jgi:Cu/Ag efflux pump CusA
MPPLDEGTILFMPTTVPGASVARIREVLRIPDEILAAFPEVETVWGTAGRAGTATDPAGLDMIETTIAPRPRSKWRDRMTAERLMAEIDEAVEEGAVERVRPKMMTGRCHHRRLASDSLECRHRGKRHEADRSADGRWDGEQRDADPDRHPDCVRALAGMGAEPSPRERSPS